MSTLDNEEEILNRLISDLMLYLIHLEKNFNEIQDSEEKSIIQEWLHLIIENPDRGVDTTRITNMALSKLVMDIVCNKLQSPFNERPSRRTFKELIDCLKAALNQNASTENEEEEIEKEPENHELDLEEFEKNMSADNRTYIAIRTLPNNGGAFGYVAITMGEGRNTQWLDTNGQPIPSPVTTNLRVVRHKEPIVQKAEPSQSDVDKVWNVLKNRKSLQLRDDSYTFYKNLYENVQQEMLAEENANLKCTNPFINKLLKLLEIDMKAINVKDLKLFCRLKMLSILKKDIKSVIKEIEKRTELFESMIRATTNSPISPLRQKCCYNFLSSTLWNEIHEHRPGTKYMDILSKGYPKYIFPKYFTALVHRKKQIFSSISSKYCNIMNEMFADLALSYITDMKKYQDSKWEWHLVHEILDAFNKEKAFKDSLCKVENSTDEATDSFFQVIINEMDMARGKLKALENKNERLAEQLPEARNEISDMRRRYNSIVDQNEERSCKLKQEINMEKRDIMKRENSISELEMRIKQFS